MVHGWESNACHRFLLSPGGISSPPAVSTVGPSHEGGGSFNGAANAIGSLRGSPNGTKLALAQRGTQVELYDFDNATGTVSNLLSPRGLSHRYYGIAFSPDNSRRYTTTYSSKGVGSDIYQDDLQAGPAEATRAPER
ncbi:hypothetical protein GCM10022408_04440 [Hymenobacter fastidiosus]|uniref:Lactonase family protein n=1 Tax=Hymenobacter fastidiosus TaxID=486264 RepID=A0ABP7RFZ1_9BACT